MIVADASVVLKWFCPDEENADRARRLKEDHILGKERLTGPELLWYEVANVLRVKRKELSDALEAFSIFCSLGVEAHSLGPVELAKAMSLSELHSISTYDASYVVLAQELRCHFVTADEHLLSRLKDLSHVRHLKDVTR